MGEAEQQAWRKILDQLANVGEEVSVTIRGESGGSYVGKLRRMDEYYNLGFYQVGVVLEIGGLSRARAVATWVIFHVSGVASVASVPREERADHPNAFDNGRPTGLTPDDLAALGIPPR